MIKRISIYFFHKHEIINLIFEVMFICFLVGKVYLIYTSQNTFKEDILNIFSKQTLMIASLYDGENRSELNPKDFKFINDTITKYSGVFIPRCGTGTNFSRVEFVSGTPNANAIKQLINNEMSLTAVHLNGDSCYNEREIKTEGVLEYLTKNEEAQFIIDLIGALITFLLISIKIHYYFLSEKFIVLKFKSSTPNEYRK